MVGKSLTEGKGLRKGMNRKGPLSGLEEEETGWGSPWARLERVPDGLRFFFPGGPRKGEWYYWACVLLGREKGNKGSKQGNRVVQMQD